MDILLKKIGEIIRSHYFVRDYNYHRSLYKKAICHPIGNGKKAIYASIVISFDYFSDIDIDVSVEYEHSNNIITYSKHIKHNDKEAVIEATYNFADMIKTFEYEDEDEDMFVYYFLQYLFGVNISYWF